MRAWTVDADDIRVAEDLDDALLHHTPEIDSFLNLDRDDKFIAIGTKGFGKTLLLKAKRILYQRDGRAACLPVGNLLDKPIGDKVFTKEALAFFAASSLPWSRLWLTAIAAATLKHLGRADGLKLTARLTSVMADERLHGVIDHFVRLLDFSPSELQRAAADTDGHLLPRLRAINSPVAIFIDGVDEYFNKHIESRASLPSVTGPLAPSVWYFAQLGLVEVAYQLRRINHHLKVFAAIRKEAYARLQTTVMSQQYRGSAVDIVYPIESLREIFVNNIRLEKSDRMVRPERLRADPLEAFLGRAKIAHVYTGEEEDAFDYICRHTLLRPRDLMTIGERLTALRPEERRHEHRVKEAVNLGATEIAREYLTEIAPYVGDLDLERLLGRIPGHILTRDEVEELFRSHNGEGAAVDERHVFCALYRVGLLGHLHHDWVRGDWVQRFLRPGEGTLEPDGVLPRATHYLVHPVLSDVIGRLNPGYLGAHRPGRHRGLQPRLAWHLERRAGRHLTDPLRPHGRRQGLRRVDPGRRGRRCSSGARGSREEMDPRDDRRRGRRRRHRLGRARRSRRAGAGRPPSDGRGIPRSRPAAAPHRAALWRRTDPKTRDRRRPDDRRRRSRALRGPGRAARRAGPDLGDRGIPRSARRSAFFMAHHADDGPDGAVEINVKKEGRDGAGSLGPAPSARILSGAIRPESGAVGHAERPRAFRESLPARAPGGRPRSQTPR